AEDGIRDFHVTGVQTCALPIYPASAIDGRLPWQQTTETSTMSFTIPFWLPWCLTAVAIALVFVQGAIHGRRIRALQTSLKQRCEIGRASCRRRGSRSLRRCGGT